ncbi:MAG: sugar transferase [Pleurocapsa minor GSE-CHR-MK-17-07R]|jgi:exopolysaccharide biosynthesis polyprenyl glycosylphosphotransferase|nr:sugar transferase [Pleurocapsa minor GSE-CHR-MK 17-07R]
MRENKFPVYYSPINRRKGRQLQFSERKLVILAGDVLAICAAIFLALRIWAAVAERDFSAGFVLEQAVWFPVLVLLWVLLARANDFYDLRLASKPWKSFGKLLIIEVQLVIVYMIVFFVSPRDALPRLFILYYGVGSFALIGMWRFARPALVGWVSQPRRTMIVGSGWSAQTIIEAVREYATDEYELRGVIALPDDVGTTIADLPVVGSGADLMNFVLRDGITELVVTETSGLNGSLFQGVMDAYERGIRVVPMSILYEAITGRVPVEHVNNDWAVIFLQNTSGDNLDAYGVLKRLIDVGLSLAGLLVFALILPFIALAIRLNSAGPIFYTQQRVGKNGAIFRIYKLRTMVQNAERATGAVFAQKGDARVTQVGRFLRKTRIDELPQLYNVLVGHMSLVGPRPERPEHVDRLMQKIPFYRTRHIVRPGLTGWAQVRYSYGSTDEDAMVKLQYDLYYVRHVSLLLDVNILLRTVGKVLSMSGI